MKAYDRRRQTLEIAWIGDAVLTLYARQAILESGTGIDNAKASRMTSNRFLSALGEASEVEAAVGRVYLAEGLAAAFTYIQRSLIPLFEKQERRIAPPPVVNPKV